LVIEAKKTMDSQEDIQVVKSFMMDPRYHYVFGLTVCYNGFNPIKATLFYKDGNQNMQNEPMGFPI